MAHDLRANLDQLLLEARQRPVFDRLGRRERAEEVAEIVGKRVKLNADSVRGEGAAGKPGLSDRALALLDPLFACAALVVERDDILGRPRYVGYDEAHTWISSPECHSTLATTRRGFVQLSAR
jgi:hypothetical protein